jgi:hypothetical protein
LSSTRPANHHHAQLAGNSAGHLADRVFERHRAGYRANATLAATLSDLTEGVQRFDDADIRMRSDLTADMWKAATGDAADRLCIVPLRAGEGQSHIPPPPHPGTQVRAANGSRHDIESSTGTAAAPPAASPAENAREAGCEWLHVDFDG